MNNASAGEDLEFRYGAIITKLVPVKCGCAFTGDDGFDILESLCNNRYIVIHCFIMTMIIATV